MALRQLTPFRIDNTDLIAGQRLTTGDKLQGTLILLLSGDRLTPGGQRFTLYPIDKRPSSRGRKGEADGALGQTVDRDHHLPAETIAPKALDKASYRFGADRFGTIKGHAQRAEIEPLDIARSHLIDTELVGKVGSGRKRPPVGMDGP